MGSISPYKNSNSDGFGSGHVEGELNQYIRVDQGTSAVVQAPNSCRQLQVGSAAVGQSTCQDQQPSDLGGSDDLDTEGTCKVIEEADFYRLLQTPKKFSPLVADKTDPDPFGQEPEEVMGDLVQPLIQNPDLAYVCTWQGPKNWT